MLIHRLAANHLYGNSCSTGCRWWCLSLRLFVLSFFSLDVLDEIWGLIESVSEGFLFRIRFCSLLEEDEFRDQMLVLRRDSVSKVKHFYIDAV